MPVTACPPDSAPDHDLIRIGLLDDFLEVERFAADLVLGDAEDFANARPIQSSSWSGELVRNNRRG